MRNLEEGPGSIRKKMCFFLIQLNKITTNLALIFTNDDNVKPKLERIQLSGATQLRTTLNAWHRCGQLEKILDISSRSPNISRYKPPEHISVPCTHLCFGVIVLSFPAPVPVPAPFPQSGRRTSVALPLSALCSLAKQGEVTEKDGVVRGALWLDPNK